MNEAEQYAADNGITAHAGYMGVFTRQTVPGAIPSGTRIRKALFVIGDTSPVGALGVVLGSVAHPELGPAYFVEWDHAPRCAVFCMGVKIARADAAPVSGARQ